MIRILYFLTQAVVNILIHIYAVNSEPASIKLDAEYQGINGHPNGRVVRDAEEFELHGLADDDDELTEEEGLLKENQGIRHQ
jgi:hypothetical protein